MPFFPGTKRSKGKKKWHLRVKGVLAEGRGREGGERRCAPIGEHDVTLGSPQGEEVHQVKSLI